MKLTLIGRPTVRVHEGKAYLGISVDDLTFMGSATPRDAAPRDQGSYADKRPAASGCGRPGGYGDTMDDDIPFGSEVRA